MRAANSSMMTPMTDVQTPTRQDPDRFPELVGRGHHALYGRQGDIAHEHQHG